ncbi:MAG TPA: GNAT family N-acetyltransferase [Chitinophagaceae bacterium]|nr:GNAT family N-acetyltransferase [Chitinophagaceae bacterium]
MITNDNIEIKRIGVADVALLSDVATRAYSDHYTHLWYDGGKWYIEKSFSAENLIHELEDINAWFFIIYYNKEAVGFLKLNINTPLPSEENTNALELERIYLTKAVTEKRIGKYLLEHIFKIAKEKNKKLVWLKVMDSSTGAIQFYKKMGFEICSTYQLPFEIMKPEFRGMYVMKKLL